MNLKSGNIMFNWNNLLLGLGGISGLILLVASVGHVFYRRKQWLETKGINESLKELIKVMGK